MRLIKPEAYIEHAPTYKAALLAVERAGRTCYKSEDKITEGSAEKMVSALIKSGHESVLEHISISVRFIVDRGVSHELVRHRLFSYSQESTRYCNYSKGGDIQFIIPCWFDGKSKESLGEGVFKSGWQYPNGFPFDNRNENIWVQSMMNAEEDYIELIKGGWTAQEARSVLPNSVKTELVMTGNIRSWRHFFKLRALGATGKPHPQMLEVSVPLLESFAAEYPVFFEDLEDMI